MPEVLAVLALGAVLVVLALAGAGGLLAGADRVKMAGVMRSVGAAISARAADHAGLLPGPLWPGQVAHYDRNRAGRLVVELAPYLGVEERAEPYVVERLLTRSLRRATPGVAPQDVRLFVMNMQVPTPEGTLNPWGSLAAAPPGAPVPLARVQALGRPVALSEADREHPAVATAPWAAFAAPSPPHGRPRLQLYFDGSVGP